ncbi:Glucitol operon repressor [compost metagenome]
MMSNFTLKQKLAQYAASLVNDDETIFIESGSANALLARYIAERKRITLITVSHYIANLLKETDCEVIVLGGLYQKKSETVVGPLTRQCIQQVHFSKAFIGIDGYHADTGFTGRDMMRADVVNAVLAKGVENIVLTDSSKFGQIQPNPLTQQGKVHRVITDSRLSLDYQHQLKRQGIQLDIVND